MYSVKIVMIWMSFSLSWVCYSMIYPNALGRRNAFVVCIYDRGCAFSTCTLALLAIQSGASNVRYVQFSGSQPAKYGATRPTRVKKMQSGWALLLAYYLHLLFYNSDWWLCLWYIQKRNQHMIIYRNHQNGTLVFIYISVSFLHFLWSKDMIWRTISMLNFV